MVKNGITEGNVILLNEDDSFLKALEHLLLLSLKLLDNRHLLHHLVDLTLLSVVNVRQLLVTEHKERK